MCKHGGRSAQATWVRSGGPGQSLAQWSRPPHLKQAERLPLPSSSPSGASPACASLLPPQPHDTVSQP